MSLTVYRRKRDFRKSTEPRGALARRRTSELAFVVQKHAATRLHYDFRLELDGTLKSWAVPKGPCLDPREKRLAVEVEDHPLEYGSFEGTIPEGNYGAGEVIVWDRGTWQPLGDPREGYRRGQLKLQLAGEKLRGGWALIKLRGRPGDGAKPNWLLIKERDRFARPLAQGDVLAEKPRSVASGRRIEDLQGSPPQPKPKQNQKQRQPRIRQPRAAASRPAAARKAPLPRVARPQLATLVDEVPAGEGWIHEIKLDGYRLLCRLDRGRVKLLSRNGKDWSARLPGLVAAAARLPARQALLDGELVRLDRRGVSDFQLLQNALSDGAEAELRYHVFDLLHLDGFDLAVVPLVERKAALAALLEGVKEPLQYASHVEGNGRNVYREACKLGLEGIVSKRRDGRHHPGRGTDWLKVKCSARQEMVIGGWSEPAGSRTGLGALLLGIHDADGALRYAGKVGTGFTAASLEELHARLAALAQDRSPFTDPPTGAEARGSHWVRPRLVAEVQLTGWTRAGRLRHPSFKGLRLDKRAAEVRRERPRTLRARRVAPRTARKPRRGASGPRPRAPAPAAPAGDGAIEVAGVRLTSPGKVLYTRPRVTKSDLAHYYEQVADWMLPHVRGRPLMLHRCPEGMAGDCFFQKHAGMGLPRAIQEASVRESSGTARHLVVDSLAGLVALVQIGCLEIHTWGSRAGRLEQPDRVVFDLDPGPGVAWSSVVRTALLVRDRLARLGLESFVRTTGGKGLHVVAPLDARAGWTEVKGFARAFATALAAADPRRLVVTAAKSQRASRTYIDYLRNGRGATAIESYSTRAREGCPVATPISWRELTRGVRPDAFTIESLPRRLERLKQDPWKEYASLRQGLPATLER